MYICTVNMLEIYKKIYDIQKEVGAITKDETNPHFKNTYFDINTLIEHIHPLLSKYNLILLQPISGTVISSQIIDIDSGEMIDSSIDFALLSDPQKMGSLITYYRRYTLQSLLGLRAEDDDANAASGRDTDDKPWINIGSKEWKNAVSKKIPLTKLKDHYKINKANATQYEIEINI